MWRSWRPRSAGAGTARPRARRSKGCWGRCRGACSPPHGSTLDGSVGSGSPTHRSCVLVSLIGTRLPILLVGAVAVTIVGTIPAPTAEALWRGSSHQPAGLPARRGTRLFPPNSPGRHPWGPSGVFPPHVGFLPFFSLL